MLYVGGDTDTVGAVAGADGKCEQSLTDGMFVPMMTLLPKAVKRLSCPFPAGQIACPLLNLNDVSVVYQ